MLRQRLVKWLLHVLTRHCRDLALLKNVLREVENAEVLVEDRIRHVAHDGKIVATKRGNLASHVMSVDAPWRHLDIPPRSIPGMISAEEAQYYEYIGRQYQGVGEVVELGPWLGRSTVHISRGLHDVQAFNGKKLHVYDDFIWRSSWMDAHLNSAERPANHESFRHLFDRYIGAKKSMLNVTTAKITDYEGNEHLPLLQWSGDPIELIFVDCGRTMQVNKAWYDLLSPFFVPGVTLVMMQDWRTHRERPRLIYNQTLWFTAGRPKLKLLHEVVDGGLATFVYDGATTP